MCICIYIYTHVHISLSLYIYIYIYIYIELTYIRILKSARFARMIRLVRVLRLLRMRGKITEMLELIESKSSRIILGIVKIFVFICFTNHFIACFFWGLGDNLQGATWVKKFEMKQRDLFYQYTTSLHWSLTQFTPASMEIVPCNGWERLFSVCTILLAMMTFSSLVSSLTNAATQLRNLNAVSNARDAMLRRYLVENNVPPALRSRIWSWVKGFKGSRTRTKEEDVVLLNTLPSALAADLHEQVYGPQLEPHPFFFQLMQDEKARGSPVRIFKCLQEITVLHGKDHRMEQEPPTPTPKHLVN